MEFLSPTNADGHGPEGLYYNRPWEFDGYHDFQRYSQAFTNAWNSALAAQRQAREEAHREARMAALDSRTSYLEGRLADLDRSPSLRGSRGGASRTLDLDQLRADGAKNRDRFSEDMGW